MKDSAKILGFDFTSAPKVSKPRAFSFPPFLLSTCSCQAERYVNLEKAPPRRSAAAGAALGRDRSFPTFSVRVLGRRYH